jgi:hypothetical protein
MRTAPEHWALARAVSASIAATFEKLLSMGAREYQPITPRGDNGFVTAAVVDPFGNVLGIMHNPHYLEMLRTCAAV